MIGTMLVRVDLGEIFLDETFIHKIQTRNIITLQHETNISWQHLMQPTLHNESHFVIYFISFLEKYNCAFPLLC